MAQVPDTGPPRPGTQDEAVAALRRPGTFPDRSRRITARETRMSWVFLTPRFAYKLKKAATTPYLDLSTPEARHHWCEEEVRLNARLAPGIYRGVVPLVRTASGALRLGGTGAVVDWLIRMRRLPAASMLDTAIRRCSLTPAAIDAVAQRLAAFFAAAPAVALPVPQQLARFAREQALNRAMLRDPRFGLAPATVDALLGPLDAVLRDECGILASWLAPRRIIEGHGDLRPEHVFLGRPPAVIDCLEFSRALRLLDPFEELAFLGMECVALGADWIGPRLVARCANRLGDAPPDGLLGFYGAFRAALRARQALAHLLDPHPRVPAKWLPQAQRYLAVGAAAARRISATAA